MYFLNLDLIKSLSYSDGYIRTTEIARNSWREFLDHVCNTNQILIVSIHDLGFIGIEAKTHHAVIGKTDLVVSDKNLFKLLLDVNHKINIHLTSGAKTIVVTTNYNSMESAYRINLRLKYGILSVLK